MKNTEQIQTLLSMNDKFRKNLDIYPTEADVFYLDGEDTIKQHVKKLVNDTLRLPLSQSLFDHHDSWAGHSLLEAMKATGSCCRTCLYEFRGIPTYRELESHEVENVVESIFAWLNKNMLA